MPAIEISSEQTDAIVQKIQRSFLGGRDQESQMASGVHILISIIIKVDYIIIFNYDFKKYEYMVIKCLAEK